jgi:hypothetical protein
MQVREAGGTCISTESYGSHHVEHRLRRRRTASLRLPCIYNQGKSGATGCRSYQQTAPMLYGELGYMLMRKTDDFACAAYPRLRR